MEAESSYPKYRISAAYQRGKQLTTVQRTSSTFDPEPKIGPWSLRPGQKPTELTEAQFKAVSLQIKNAVRSGSIVAEVLPNGTGNWIKIGSDAAPVEEVVKAEAPPAPAPAPVVEVKDAVTVETTTAVADIPAEAEAPVETKKKKGKA